MKILCKVTFQGLVPLYPSDYEEKKKLKLGSEVAVTITKPRELWRHKKFFALLNIAYQNQDTCVNFDIYRQAILIQTGYKKDVITKDGELIPIANSISFGKMDETEFETLYNDVHKYICESMGFDEELIINEILDLM